VAAAAAAAAAAVKVVQETRGLGSHNYLGRGGRCCRHRVAWRDGGGARNRRDATCFFVSVVLDSPRRFK